MTVDGIPPTVQRAPRVRITPAHRLVFALDEDPTTPGLTMANISISGMALLGDALKGWPPMGSRIQGWLRITDQQFPVIISLVHMTGKIVGCVFETPAPAMLVAIENYLGPELEAATMVREDPRAPGAQRGEGSHWYHGKGGSELFYVLASGQVQRFSLVFFGSYLEGGFKRPVRFGVIVDDKNLEEDLNQAVRWFDTINAEQLSLTIRLIQAIPTLPTADRDAILKVIC